MTSHVSLPRSLNLVLFMLSFCLADHASAIPSITAFPQLSASPLVANNATAYTIGMTVGDTDGNSFIREARTLFNLTEAQFLGSHDVARGYLAWGLTDNDITRFGGTWVIYNATGGGRWGYMTSDWGETQYVIPTACSVTYGGLAAGGQGTVTVVWSFRAKATWAGNPLTNDADAWASNGTVNIGWLDNPNEFDVVAQSCTSYAETPHAPVLTNPREDAVDVRIDPRDASTNTYALAVSPDLDGKKYVQADGTLGPIVVYRAPADWGTTTITGLLSSMEYAVAARAVGTSAGMCASAYGQSATVATQLQSRAIDTSVAGKEIHPGVMGSASRLDGYPNNEQALLRIWEIVGGNSVRGVAGGMDADTYNWKDMSGQGVGHGGTPGPAVATTLKWMRYARDYRPEIPVITVNTRGTGPLASSGWCTFYYTDNSIEPLQTLAADWVRYVNHILPTYRSGDTLPATDQAVIDSLQWYGRPTLLDPGEAATPRVVYWEIGNEPELTLPWCTPDKPTQHISPEEYRQRYRAITAAMLAVDPTIKVGPCTIGEVYSGAVLADPAARVDFVSYHPYGPLSSYANSRGDTAETAEAALRVVRSQQVTRFGNILATIRSTGRDPDRLEYLASEWNPSSWQWECSGKDRRMSHALGLAETIFTFAELGLTAAHYWSYATSCASTTEAPMYKVLQMLQQHLGRELVDSYCDGYNFRMYTTRDPSTGSVAVWGLNFSEQTDKQLELRLNLPQQTTLATYRLGRPSGDTSLMDVNSSPSQIVVDWVRSASQAIDPTRVGYTFEDATLSVLVFQPPAGTPLPTWTPTPTATNTPLPGRAFIGIH